MVGLRFAMRPQQPIDGAIEDRRNALHTSEHIRRALADDGDFQLVAVCILRRRVNVGRRGGGGKMVYLAIELVHRGFSSLVCGVGHTDNERCLVGDIRRADRAHTLENCLDKKVRKHIEELTGGRAYSDVLGGRAGRETTDLYDVALRARAFDTKVICPV